jgi:hypothetical protein
VRIAEGSFTVGSCDERLFKELMERNERFRKLLDEIAKEFSRTVNVYFEACVTCKRLYMTYAHRGWYLEIIGSLTDEATALLIAGKIKE